jgi:hypothetical protein
VDVGKEHEQERKLFRQVWVVFAGNAGFRYRSNRLIPAYWIVLSRIEIESKRPRGGATRKFCGIKQNASFVDDKNKMQDQGIK